jgi:hypothetical protein
MNTYLSKERGLACLVLGDLVGSVLAALLALAECLSLLGNIDHCECDEITLMQNAMVQRNRSAHIVRLVGPRPRPSVRAIFEI